jgi:hypothetical protein
MPFDAIKLAWRRLNKTSPLEPSKKQRREGASRLTVG